MGSCAPQGRAGHPSLNISLSGWVGFSTPSILMGQEHLRVPATAARAGQGHTLSFMVTTQSRDTQGWSWQDAGVGGAQVLLRDTGGMYVLCHPHQPGALYENPFR